jgi:hypothetical protein
MNAYETIRPGAVFEIAADLRAIPDTLKLRNLEWGLLFAVTGEHTVAQIAQHFGLELAAIAELFGRLSEAQLVRERPVSYGEYLRAAATVPDDRPKNLAQFLRAGSAFSQPSRVNPEPFPASRGALAPPVSTPAVFSPKPEAAKAPEPRPLELGLGSLEEFDPTMTRAVATFSPEALDFEPLAPLQIEDAPEAQGRSRRLSLKAVMQFILERAPDLQSGQLDVYRVFIRISSKLLKRNGITTLRFHEDRLVEDLELQEAIKTSVEKTLGLACPSQVFV